MNENELAETLDLNGVWDFALGGRRGAIQVPGGWEAQGYDKYLDGPAVYRRKFCAPAAWAGRRIALRFDAISYHAEVAIDGQAVGEHRGLWTPFEIDVSAHVTPGREHELAVTVYKPGARFPVREALAGFLPDVCTTFGGIWQPARLIAYDQLSIGGVRLTIDADRGRVALRAATAPVQAPLVAVAEVTDPAGVVVARSRDDFFYGGELDIALTVPNFRRWSPGSPTLYTLALRLERAGRPVAQVTRRFGFRKLARDGAQLLFNDAPVCLRGLLHWGWYPDWIAPAPDDAAIRDEFRRARAMGYNLVKLCLWVPPPRYFEIADEEGMFLWLELPMWLPQVTERLRAHAPHEYAGIMARVHHHPSAVLYSLGCELNRSVDAALLGALNDAVRGYMSGALLCDNSGSGEAYGGLGDDFADFSDYHFYCDLHHFDPLVDHFRRDWQPPRPWIFGEFCDSDDYRDPDEIRAAHDGVMPWWWAFKNPIHAPIRAARAEMDRVPAATGRSHQELMHIARAESLVVRKTIIEKVRRRAGMGGYVITGFRDTPVATSAPFDDLGRAKEPPEAVRAFNADTVLVLDQGRLRTWQHGGDRPRRRDLFNHAAGDPVSLRLILSHAGASLPGAALNWRIAGPEGRVYAEETATLGPVTGGRPREAAAVRFVAPDVTEATTLTLEATLEGITRNRWKLWVYPKVEAWPGVEVYDPVGCLGWLEDITPGMRSRIWVASAPPPDLGRHLRAGGRALLLQAGPEPLRAQPCPFWRESIKLIEAHPVMRALPHEGFADLQFYSLATDYALAPGALAGHLPGVEITPVLARLDARVFTLAHYIVEGRLGAGRVIASTLRFQGSAGDQPSGLRDNPAGRFLLKCMLDYLLA